MSILRNPCTDPISSLGIHRRSIKVLGISDLLKGEQEDLESCSVDYEEFFRRWNKMDMELTSHAELKIKERMILQSEIEEILKKPTVMFLDIETGYLVAVGARSSIKGHMLILVYSSGERIKLITVIDTSKKDIMRTREKKGRWVRIK